MAGSPERRRAASEALSGTKVLGVAATAHLAVQEVQGAASAYTAELADQSRAAATSSANLQNVEANIAFVQHRADSLNLLGTVGLLITIGLYCMSAARFGFALHSLGAFRPITTRVQAYRQSRSPKPQPEPWIW